MFFSRNVPISAFVTFLFYLSTINVVRLFLIFRFWLNKYLFAQNNKIIYVIYYKNNSKIKVPFFFFLEILSS